RARRGFGPAKRCRARRSHAPWPRAFGAREPWPPRPRAPARRAGSAIARRRAAGRGADASGTGHADSAGHADTDTDYADCADANYADTGAYRSGGDHTD